MQGGQYFRVSQVQRMASFDEAKGALELKTNKNYAWSVNKEILKYINE